MSKLGNYASAFKSSLDKGIGKTADNAYKIAGKTGNIMKDGALASIKGNVFSASMGNIIRNKDNKVTSDKNSNNSISSGGNSGAFIGPLNNTDTMKNGLSDITSSGAYGNSYANAKNQAVRNQVASGWDDADSLRSSVSKEIDDMSKSTSKLGAARDAYLKANEENLAKKRAAIAGNRELITKNQKGDLTDLANSVRNNIFNTNLSLGVLGAANSSASGAASKALARTAGKDRKAILQGYGDQISGQNQEEANAQDYYSLQRKNAYEWEDRQKKIAQEEYLTNKKVLSKLKSKLPDWKKDDIDDEDNQNLSKFLEQVAEISARARAFRDTLNGWITEMGGNTQELSASNIGIDTPAALDTPEFTDELSIGPAEEEEDFYNPNIKDKKKEGDENDILSNPLIFAN